MTDVRSVFGDLMGRVSAEWAAVHRDELAFPSLARAALEAARIHEALDFDRLVDLVLDGDLPPQVESNDAFAPPPITIARGEGLVVELVFWADRARSVHQVDFHGAFQVFTGGGIHTRYRFEEKRRVSSSLLFGDLSLTGAELLSRGDVREVAQGQRVAQVTFPTERPTVTIVLRTLADTTAPRYEHRRPSVAFDPSYARPTLRKRLELLRMLQHTDVAAFWRAVPRLMRGDLLATYEVLARCEGGFGDARLRAKLLGLARDAHGADAEPLLRAIEASAQERTVVHRRHEEADDEARFLLAVLAMVPSRQAILDLLAARYPSRDPVETVIRGVEKLDFNADAIALCRALLAKKRDHRTVRVALAREGYRVANDYALLEAIRVVRETPGFAALFGE
ncbi:MAG: hypothetical protein KIT84_05700 [Labilithrix sp.]|nr:hypothetical protein [Labilithrix sp.]MCW5810483.1 hypothetical protein [Labilithrix sp.]